MGIGLDKDMLRMWVRHKDPNRSGLSMWGLGVAPNGDKTYDMLPMNSEGDEVDASQGVGVSQTTYAKPHATAHRPNDAKQTFTRNFHTLIF